MRDPLLRLLPAPLVPALTAVAALAANAAAQWAYLPYNPPQTVIATNWYVAHDTGNGIAAVSAIAARTTTISPPGSLLRAQADAVLMTQEGTSTLRGWSALRNSSATQPVTPGYVVQTSANAAGYVLVLDLAPGTAGVLRAYSAYTNTWASRPLSQPQTFGPIGDANVAVQRDGLNYHAYSAHTGKWVTMTIAATAGSPFAYGDFAAIDLHGTSGPLQYAAFSALRGAWSLSPTYPATGAGVVSGSANAFAIRTDLGAPTAFQYAGNSPLTGQWRTSSLVHTTGSSVQGQVFKNVVRISDTDTAARFEIFGAGNGIWQSITGAGLSESSVHDDFHVVTSSNGSSTTVYAASALVGGGYTSLVVPQLFPGIASGSHTCLVTGGATQQTNSAWLYSALTNSFFGPVPQPLGSNVFQGGGGAVAGFVLQGSAAFGSHAEACSVRWGTWVPGPAIATSDSYVFNTGNSLAVATKQFFPGYEFNLFDEHRNAWLPPIGALAPSTSYVLGPNCMLYTEGSGTWHAYSTERGDWVTEAGFGSITSAGGFANRTDHLAWFTDSNGRVCVFATPGGAQVWADWPLAPTLQTSGATPGGSAPYVGVSARGAATEFGLLYASLSLPPAPIAIPGIGGAIDLGLGDLVQVAALGLFGADGVLAATLPIGPPVPAATSLWLQLVTVDLLSGQIALRDRSTGCTFF